MRFADAMSDWPAVGTRVVVWTERPPSKTPREPHETIVDHVAGRTFTVSGLDATFNRSIGRSKPVRRSAGAFGTETYVAVDADSDRAREVLGLEAHRQLEDEAVQEVRTWLTDRSADARRAALNALTALNAQNSET